jgi:hypothetical protein
LREDQEGGEDSARIHLAEGEFHSAQSRRSGGSVAIDIAIGFAFSPHRFMC